MIITELYDGQGLVNQLWCYIVTRVIAKKNGYDFGIMSIEKFKGKEFMFLDFGKTVVGGSGPEGGPPTTLPESIMQYYKENLIRHPNTGLDISPLDNNLVNVPDNTKIDGTMQSVEYLRGYRNNIIDMLTIKDDKKVFDYTDDNICIIHIRGGDFKNSSAMLYTNYYTNGMKKMYEKNSNMRFYIVTDDIQTASQILPNIQIIGSSIMNVKDCNKASHHIGGPIWVDYSILNNAKNVIMSASSFGWWPVWTSTKNPFVIAPKYWAGHKINGGYWSCGESLVDEWNYLDINGEFFTSEQCKKEL